MDVLPTIKTEIPDEDFNTHLTEVSHYNGTPDYPLVQSAVGLYDPEQSVTNSSFSGEVTFNQNEQHFGHADETRNTPVAIIGNNAVNSAEADTMSGSQRVYERLGEVLERGNNPRSAWCQWMTSELMSLPDELWRNFQNESFQLVMRFQEQNAVRMQRRGQF